MLKNYFDKLDGYELVQHKIDVPEIQSDSCSEIASQSAIYAAREIDEPCIKMDAGFFINSLGGFPGPFVKYINQWLNEKDIMSLLDGKSDRSAYFLDATAISFPDGSSKIFTKRYDGRIALPGEYKSSKWPANSIFIPDDYDKLLGSLTSEEQEAYWHGGVLRDILDYIQKI